MSTVWEGVAFARIGLFATLQRHNITWFKIEVYEHIHKRRLHTHVVQIALVYHP